MSTQRLTITLPSDLARQLRREASEARRPVSRIVAEALAKREDERIRGLMIEGYKEGAALNKQLAEEFWPIAAETWPSD